MSAPCSFTVTLPCCLAVIALQAAAHAVQCAFVSADMAALLCCSAGHVDAGVGGGARGSRCLHVATGDTAHDALERITSMAATAAVVGALGRASSLAERGLSAVVSVQYIKAAAVSRSAVTSWTYN